MLLQLHALILRLTGYRWSSYHRHYDTWQYRWLHTTRANQLAEQKKWR